MFTRSRILNTVLKAALLGALLVAAPAAAQKVVMEPNGFPVPQPANPLEQACCGPTRGFPASALELSGLFAYRNERINWESDARTGPGVFSPLCGFSGTLVLRGGNCRLDFGWYNVVPGSTTPPADSEIYTLIPNTDPDVYGAPGMNVDFCPLAGISTQVQNNNRCTLKTFNADNIRMDPRYKQGLIGFALKGNPTSMYCPETHYSQNELHAKCANCTPAAPWIMALQYQSTVSPDAFYLAFEDSRAGTFGPGMANDGDFNDFVFFISGVTCEGGGQPCDASAANPALQGACAAGKTACSSMPNTPPECKQVVQPVKESCDNLDNDCNGMVDDGNLCEAGQVCDKGNCVSACNTGEFTCAVGYECNAAGYCVEPACKDVMCNSGQVCRGGQCVGGCMGVTCPNNQECQLGRCVDLCAGLKCGDNQVCERGACVSTCACRPCIAGKTCGGDGKCVDTACKDKTCGAGTFCAAGECKNACDGAVCPGGAACANGQCGDPLPGTVNPGTGGGPPTPGGPGGPIIPIPTNGGSSSSTGGSGNPGSPGGGPRSGVAESGCACGTVPSSTPNGWLALGLLGLGASAFIRRRQGQIRPSQRA